MLCNINCFEKMEEAKETKNRKRGKAVAPHSTVVSGRLARKLLILQDSSWNLSKWPLLPTKDLGLHHELTTVKCGATGKAFCFFCDFLSFLLPNLRKSKTEDNLYSRLLNWSALKTTSMPIVAEEIHLEGHSNENRIFDPVE